jgi:hypothetical protein
MPVAETNTLTASRSAAHLLLPLSLALACATRVAAGADYCVGSSAELQTALDIAASDDSALFTTTVMLKTGTYHVGSTSLIVTSTVTRVHALELLGGYNSDCSARSINPDSTVFDADANDLRMDPLADLLVEGIRFQNVAGQYGQVTIRTAANDIGVRLRLNAFVGASANVVTGFDTDFDRVSGLTVKFIGNRVHGYAKPSATSNSAVQIAGATQIRFTANTIADNAGEHAVYICSSSDVALLDNIGWNNTGDDFRVAADCGDANTPGDAQFKTNLYQGITLNTIGDSGGNIAATDPKFVGAGAGNYRLQNTSPAINTGFVTSSLTDVDLAGNARVVGSTVDIGAYESAIDDTIPATLTVTNTNDSGAGSLRQALLDANANPDFTFVNFQIATGSCPHVIAPLSDLPTITSGVRIDGFSQPGSAVNTRSVGDNATRCIVLAGGNARTFGLNFSGGSTQQFWVQGLALGGFNPGGGSGAALRVAGGTNNIVWGNQFGGQLPSVTLAPNYDNVLLTGASSSTAVGGSSPAQRNVIAGASNDGVRISRSGLFASTGNDIAGNLIGSYATESASAGNNVGVHVMTSGNTVRDNTIVNSASDGVRLETTGAHDNVIESNRIGVTDPFCGQLLCFELAAPNGRDGILLSFGPSTNIVYQNRIHDNVNRGIEIGSSSGAVSARNWLIANSVYANGAQGTLFNSYNGADNDADAAQQDMANRGLNYPSLVRAYGGTKRGRVEGTLATTNGSYSVDVFSSAQADDNPRGEGDLFHRTFFGVTINNAAPGQNGSGSFTVPFASATSLAGRVITVTVSDALGNTSELSAPVAYLCDVIFADSFDGGLGDKCPSP